MHTLIVLCHPTPPSFCHAITQKISHHLQHPPNYTIIDLYSEYHKGNFAPVLTQEEIKRKTSFDPAIQHYTALLGASSRLVVVHPDWWGNMPALLKGWIDRVFRPEVAYQYTTEEYDAPKKVQGLMHKTNLLVIVTSHANGEEKSVQSLQAMWNHTATFCAFARFRLLVMGNLHSSTLRQRRSFLDQVCTHL